MDIYLYNFIEVFDDVSEGKDYVIFEFRLFGFEKFDGDVVLMLFWVRIKCVYI